MKGKLRQVSPYGFRVEGDPNWHNFIKNRNKVFSENAKKFKGMEIEWEENEAGLVTRLGTPDKKEVPITNTKPSNSLLIKGFYNQSLKGLEEDINDFGKENSIKATQTHIKGEGFVAFVWY